MPGADEVPNLSDIIRDNDQLELCIDSFVSRGSIEISRPIRITIGASSSSEIAGPVYIRSSGVELVGMVCRGPICIDESSCDVKLNSCKVSGSVRVSKGCKNVSLESCSISPERRGVGLQVFDPENLLIRSCRISNCLVGVSISRGTAMAPLDSFAQPHNPECRIESSAFRSNSTDVVVQMAIVSGAKGESTAVLYPSHVLETSDSHISTFDVSISGKLDTPLTFKSWPIDMRSVDGRSVPRRGYKSSGRCCHIKLDGDTLIICEDPHVQERETRGKKRRNSERISVTRAEQHYSTVLGIEPGSDRERISAAYKKLALIHHPDKEGGSDDKFIEIKKARDELISLLDHK